MCRAIQNQIAIRMGRKIRWDPVKERIWAATRPPRCLNGPCASHGVCKRIRGPQPRVKRFLPNRSKPAPTARNVHVAGSGVLGASAWMESKSTLSAKAFPGV